MAWLESHQSLGRHPKLFRFAGQLSHPQSSSCRSPEISLVVGLGLCAYGRRVRVHSRRNLGWRGMARRPGRFTRLCWTGEWIDRDTMMIHAWGDYTGRLIEKRREDRDRKRVQRTSNGHPTDIQRMSNVQTVPTQHTDKPTSVPRAAGGDPKKGKPQKSHSLPKFPDDFPENLETGILEPCGILGFGTDRSVSRR